MSMRFLAALGACLVVFTLVARPAPAADPQKKPEDFRDVKWGAPASSLPGLKQADRDGDIIHYERPADKKDFGAFSISHVTYSFYKDKFYHAEIDYSGKGAAAALQKSLEAKYGPPDATRTKTGPTGKAYVVSTWNWPGYAFIGNRHDPDGAHGRVFYFYAPLTDASAKAQGLSPAAGAAATKAAAGGYTVRRGDTLARIAKKLGTTSEALTSANPGLTDASLKAGATIALPAGVTTAKPASRAGSEATAVAAPSGSFVEYTVKSGDVLSRIASSHGTRTQDILAANPGLRPDKLRPGLVLRLPASRPSATSPAVAPASEPTPAATPEATPAPTATPPTDAPSEPAAPPAP